MRVVKLSVPDEMFAEVQAIADLEMRPVATQILFCVRAYLDGGTAKPATPKSPAKEKTSLPEQEKPARPVGRPKHTPIVSLLNLKPYVVGMYTQTTKLTVYVVGAVPAKPVWSADDDTPTMRQYARYKFLGRDATSCPMPPDHNSKFILGTDAHPEDYFKDKHGYDFEERVTGHILVRCVQEGVYALDTSCPGYLKHADEISQWSEHLRADVEAALSLPLSSQIVGDAIAEARTTWPQETDQWVAARKGNAQSPQPITGYTVTHEPADIWG